MESPGFTGQSSSWLTPSTASLTRTSTCGPTSPPVHNARCSSGTRALSPRRTERTAALGPRGAPNPRRRDPVPPTNFVTRATTSTGTAAVLPAAPRAHRAGDSAASLARDSGTFLERTQIEDAGGCARIDTAREDLRLLDFLRAGRRQCGDEE